MTTPELTCEYYNDGSIKAEFFIINGKKEGLYKRYYRKIDDDNDIGKLAKICNYINNILDGEYIEYKSNGNIKVKCNYVNGKLHGEYIKYNSLPVEEPDTQDLLQVCNYVNGELDGEFKKYYNYLDLEGELREVLQISCNYVNGEKTDYKEYNLDGSLISPAEIKREYYENGELKSEVYYLNYKKEGEFKEYYENGQIHVICNYLDGKLCGEYKLYSKSEVCSIQKLKEKIIYSNNGKILEKKEYYRSQGEYTDQVHILSKYSSEGKLVSETRYNENGTLFSVITYLKDAWEKEIVYNESGKISSVSEYLNDRKVILEIKYDENGEIISRDEYQDDYNNLYP